MPKVGVTVPVDTTGEPNRLIERVNAALEAVEHADRRSARAQQVAYSALLDVKRRQDEHSTYSRRLVAAEKRRLDAQRRAAEASALLKAAITDVVDDLTTSGVITLGQELAETQAHVLGRLDLPSPSDALAQKARKALIDLTSVQDAAEEARRVWEQAKSQFQHSAQRLATGRSRSRNALSDMMRAERDVRIMLRHAVHVVRTARASQELESYSSNIDSVIVELQRREHDSMKFDAEYENVLNELPTSGENRVSENVLQAITRLRQRRLNRTDTVWEPLRRTFEDKRNEDLLSAMYRNASAHIGPTMLPDYRKRHSGIERDLAALAGDQRELADDLRSSVLKIFARDHPAEFLHAVSQAVASLGEGFELGHIDPTVLPAVSAAIAFVMNHGGQEVKLPRVQLHVVRSEEPSDSEEAS